VPEIEIGIFSAQTGPDEAKETTRFLRVANYSAAAARLPDNVKTVGDIAPYLDKLFSDLESYMTDIQLAFRQGEFGFETDDSGVLTKVYFRYPDFTRSEGKGRVS